MTIFEKLFNSKKEVEQKTGRPLGVIHQTEMEVTSSPKDIAEWIYAVHKGCKVESEEFKKLRGIPEGFISPEEMKTVLAISMFLVDGDLEGSRELEMAICAELTYAKIKEGDIKRGAFFEALAQKLSELGKKFQ